jgi:hypothetical protein
MEKFISVFCVASTGEHIYLTFSADHFTPEEAEQSLRDKGMTVLYSTNNVIA